MKKIANINCILIGILVVIILGFTIPMHFKVNKADKVLGYAEEEIDKHRNDDGEIDDVEGSGLVITQMFYGLGFIGILAVKIVLWLFDAYAILLLVCNIVARLIYGNTKGRIIAYRIVIGLICLLLGLVDVLFLWLTIEAVSVFCIVVVLVLATVMGLLIWNTYTKRVYEGSSV